MSNLNQVDKLTEFPALVDEERNDGRLFSLSKLLWWKKSDTNQSVPNNPSSIETNPPPDVPDSNLPSNPAPHPPEEPLATNSLEVSGGGGGGRVSPSKRHLFRSDSGLSNRSNRSNPSPELLTADGSVPFAFESRTLPNVLRRISNLIAMGTHSQSNIKKYWMPDSVSKECYECAEKFTTFRRKHHCRICGQIFCSRCCSQEIPGKIIGYSGDLRVCVYCCRIVLSYLQSADLNSDLTDDLKLVSEDLQNRFGSGLSSHENSYNQNMGSGSTSLASPIPSIETPTSYHRSSLMRRKISLGYQEERFASTGIRNLENAFDSMGPPSFEGDNLINIKGLWEEMNHPINGIEWSTHRTGHMMKSVNNCIIGSELVDWLLAKRKITLRGQGVQIGQMLIEANLIECISSVEQFFLDAYALYRPTQSYSGNPLGIPSMSALQRVQENSDEALLSAQDEGGEAPTGERVSVDYGDSASQDPLWVKQIKVQDEEEEEEEAKKISPLSPASIPTPNDFFASDIPIEPSMMSSLYALDLNINTNTASISKPGPESPNEEAESQKASLNSISIISDLVSTAPPVAPIQASLTLTSQIMTDEFLQKTLLMQKRDGKELVAPMGWHSPQQLTNDSELLAFQRLCNAYIMHENDLLGQLLENFNLSPAWIDTILPLVRKVTEIVKPDVRHADDDMDIRAYVQIKKISGGRKEDSRIINGVACSKNIANRSMRSKLKAPKILLIGSSIDYQRFENRFLSLEPLVMQEADYLRNTVARIASLQPDLVMVEKTVSRLAQEYMLDQGITLVLNVKPSVMERVSRLTQGVIISSADTHVGKPQLGICHNFYLESFRTEREGSKTLMFFDGCALHLGCTLLLRGGTLSELSKVKKILKFLIFVSYNWRLERSFHIDSFAMPPNGQRINQSQSNKSREPLKPQEQPKIESGKLELIKEGGDPLQSSESEPNDSNEEVGHLGALGIQSFLDSVILSASPFIKFQLPYLETEEGKNCKLRKFFPDDIYWSNLLYRSNSLGSLSSNQPYSLENKENSGIYNHKQWTPVHPFVSLQLTQTAASDETFQRMIADFRRKGSRRLEFSTQGNTLDQSGRLSPSKRIRSNHSSWNVLDSDHRARNIHASGRVDSLDPFLHQKLAVLFCSYSPISANAPDFCVNPWVVNMDLYGRNDISLGMFLERYCFRKSYVCPARSCDTPMVHHVRKFVHQEGCVSINLKEVSTPIFGNNNENILMWSCCEHCHSMSSIVPLSVDAWSFSFAKYLELRFHGATYLRRDAKKTISPCDHSLHQSHVQYFAQHPIIASFKYSRIRIWEISLPPEELEIHIEPKTTGQLIEDIKSVAITGHGVYSNIVDIILSLKESCSIAKVEEVASSLLEQLKSERGGFKSRIEDIQVNLTSPNLDQSHSKRDTFLWKITDQIEFLKSSICETVSTWNRHSQDLINLRKKEEKLMGKGLVTKSELDPQDTSKLTASTSSHTRQDSNDIFLLPPNLSTLSTLSNSMDSASSARGDIEDSLKSTSGSTVDMSISGVIEELASSSTNQSPEGPPPSNTSPKKTLPNENPLVLNPLDLLNTSLTYSSSSYVTLTLPSPNTAPMSQDVKKTNGRANTSQGVKSPAGPPLLVVQAEEATELSESGKPEKRMNMSSNSVKNILSNFLSAQASGQVIQLPWTSIEHHFSSSLSIIPITVYENEPSSVVSFALCSAEYKNKMMEIVKSKCAVNMSKNTAEDSEDVLSIKKLKLGGDNTSLEDFQNSTGSKAPSETTKQADPYFGEGEEDKERVGKNENQIYVEFHSNVAKFYCKIYFAEQFKALRRLCISGGEEGYARSISRCISWAATGGKSGLTFCKTFDDRFVVKQMSNFEIKSFLNFAPNYFEHIQSSYAEKKPTVLGKIVGVYRVGFRNSQTTAASKMDILIMENLFYGRNISQKFDLKGSKRNRLAATTCGANEDLVLLDENLVNMVCENSIYIRPHTKTVLSLALNNDSRFLATQMVMDYSLLVGLDEDKNELVVGIIDYIRTFTWDKMIESKLKSSGILGGQGKMPTVVSPEDYQSRFCEAMDRYFLVVPDRWVGLGVGIDS